MRFHRRPFVDVVERQLGIFEEEHAGLLRDCESALRVYPEAPAEEAEERYGAFIDLVDEGQEALEELRDTYAATLDETAAGEYRKVFGELARRRLPRFGLELD